jgi:hypothetical protein
LYTNKISYCQAYCTIQALLIEIDNNKSDCSAKFPIYIEQYIAIYPLYYTDFKLLLNSNFEAAYFCPTSCQQASVQIQLFLAIDRTYTRSKYCIQLLIAVGINANNNIIQIAWALVLIENKY